MIRQLAPIISRFQSRADRSNLVPFVVDSSRSAVRPRIYRSNITERRPALGYRQPESPVREREMFVTCRARYVRRTLARPRTRPQRREVRGCWLLLPAGKPNFYVSRAPSRFGLAPRNGPPSPRRRARRGWARRGNHARLSCWTTHAGKLAAVGVCRLAHSRHGGFASVLADSVRLACIFFSRLHFLGSTAVLEEEETGQWTITAWF